MVDVYEYDYNIFSQNYPLPLVEGINKTKEQILLIATLYFAKNGYGSVSMRDIAKVMGIQPSSLYNHFESKEALWKEVLSHASHLYMLYFQHLDSALAEADTFEDVLEVIFYEPKRLVNVFTCYAFSMIQAEQFRDKYAGEIFEEVFLAYSIDFIKGWFEKCIAKNMVPTFDTQTVATIIMHSILIGLEVNVHERLKASHMKPYDPATMFAELQQFILWAVKTNRQPDSN